MFCIEVNHVKSGFFFASRNEIFASISNFASEAKVRAHPNQYSSNAAKRINIFFSKLYTPLIDEAWQIATVSNNTPIAYMQKQSRPLIGQGLLPEPMVDAVPELLHVYFDAVHCSNAREPASYWSRVAP